MDLKNIIFYGINLYWAMIYIVMQKVTNIKVLVCSITFFMIISLIKVMNKIEVYFIPNDMSFLINVSQSFDIFLGIISILMAIYIYSISLGDNFKKSVLLILLGKGRVIYLGMMVLILYYFDIQPFYFF